MTTYKEMKRQYLLKEITEEEYKKKEEQFFRRLFDLYCMDLITEEELRSRIK